MTHFRDRSMTRGGVLLVVAVLAAGLAWLTADPPTAEATEPEATADCSRGGNLDFDAPSGTIGSVANSHPGLIWKGTPSGSVYLRRGIIQGDSEYRHFTQTHLNSKETISQSFPTLPGDRIAWAIQYRGATRGDNAKLRIGPEDANPVTMTAVNASEWYDYSGVYQVPDGQTETIFAIEIPANNPTILDRAKLDSRCGVSITASFTGFTDVDGSGHTNAGDTATVTYVVKNTAAAVVDAGSPANIRGAASLTNVAVTHDLDQTTPKCPAAKKALLKPADADSADDEMTCTATYELTQDDINDGAVTATATVTGDDAKAAKARADAAGTTTVSPTVQAAGEATAKIPSITAVKKKATAVDMTAAGPDDRVDQGDKVTYSYTVTNTGAVSLSEVSVSVPGAGTANCPGAPLAAGASTTCEVTVVLTQAQVDSGELDGATVTASTSQGASAKAVDAVKTKLAAAPAVSFDKAKTAPAGKVAARAKVSYSFKVSNTGNVTLTVVSVIDTEAGRATCPKTTLAPKASTTCTAVYTATQADITAGVISNTATVTVKAADGTSVTGSDSVSFSTETGKAAASRVAGKDRYATAAVISKATFAPGVDAVYIATGVNFPDALAGSAASGGDGPILLVTKGSIPGATLTELKRLKPKRIIVLGGTGVVSAEVEIALAAHTAGRVSRLAGADRYSTAAKISASRFRSGAATAFIATGADFPDALTGGPAAAKLGGPILLTRKDELPAATVSELKRLKPKRIIVLGGTGVVSAEVEIALAAHTAGRVSRLAGADRYSTGAAVSKDGFNPGTPVAYVATGLNFPDALAGGAAGGFKDGPVLLVSGKTIPKATAAELTRLKPEHIIVLGGTAVVPQSVREALGAYLR